MTRRLLTILAIASLLAITVSSPASANGRGVCDSSVNYTQAHTSSSPNVSRSGVLATLDLDTSSLHLGFEPCYDVAGGAGDEIGGVFAYIGLYARSGSIGNCPPGVLNQCVIYFGVADCHEGQVAPVCWREFVDPPQNTLFVYTKGCGTTIWYDLGPANSNVALNFYLDTNQNFVFNADGDQKKVISKNASSVSCWAASGNRGALYGFTRWDDHDSIGQWNTPGSRLIGAQFGVYGQGWYQTNWGSGACATQAPDGDCILVAPSELRAQSQ